MRGMLFIPVCVCIHLFAAVCYLWAGRTPLCMSEGQQLLELDAVNDAVNSLKLCGSLLWNTAESMLLTMFCDLTLTPKGCRGNHRTTVSQQHNIVKWEANEDTSYVIFTHEEVFVFHSPWIIKRQLGRNYIHFLHLAKKSKECLKKKLHHIQCWV